MTPFFDDRVAAWVAARLGYARGFGECRAMGVEHKGALVAGIVFHDWQPEHGVIEVSAAGNPGWVTREVMRVALSYVFDGLGCQAVIAKTAADNEAVRRIGQTLGAAEHVIPRLRGRDQAAVIYVLTSEAWASSRFNTRDRHGWTISTASD